MEAARIAVARSGDALLTARDGRAQLRLQLSILSGRSACSRVEYAGTPSVTRPGNRLTHPLPHPNPSRCRAVPGQRQAAHWSRHRCRAVRALPVPQMAFRRHLLKVHVTRASRAMLVWCRRKSPQDLLLPRCEALDWMQCLRRLTAGRRGWRRTLPGRCGSGVMSWA